MKKSIYRKALVLECLNVTVFLEKIALYTFLCMKFLCELKSPHHTHSSALAFYIYWSMMLWCYLIVLLAGVLTFSAETGFT